MLRKKTRMRIREIARQNYVRQNGERDSIVFNAIAGSQKQIKQEFGSSLIASFLISLMIKLAIKYIEKWAEENLFQSAVPTKFEELK